MFTKVESSGDTTTDHNKMGNTTASLSPSSPTSSLLRQQGSEPSEEQVEYVYKAIVDAFEKASTEPGVMDGVDKFLLLRKIQFKLQQDQISDLSWAGIVDDFDVTSPRRPTAEFFDDEVDPPPVPPSIKERKRKLKCSPTASIRKEQQRRATGSLKPTTFQDLPQEVIGRIVNYCPRPAQDNLACTSKRNNAVVNDPALVEKHWPPKCPFQAQMACVVGDEINGPRTSLIFSNDRSRVAIYVEGTKGFGSSSKLTPTVHPLRHTPARIEVWDRSMGLLSVLECDSSPSFTSSSDIGSSMMKWKPVFSPDSELLVLEPLFYGQVGLRCLWIPKGCKLPASPQSTRGNPIITTNPTTFLLSPAVSYHVLDDALITSVTFIDNQTLAYMVHHTSRQDNRINTCRIVRGDGDGQQVTFTDPTTILFGPDRPIIRSNDEDFFPAGQVAAYAGKNGKSKNILAYAYHWQDHKVTFYDRLRNVSVARRLQYHSISSQKVRSIQFSPNGHWLVVRHTRHLSVFDCNVEKIEDIGSSKKINLKIPDDVRDGYFNDISFVNDSMIAMNYTAIYSSRQVPNEVDRKCALRFYDLKQKRHLVDLCAIPESAWSVLAIHS